ncbi:HNH endonuclease [Aneurinibacillus aneurinilyticus]|uniref:HNH endonuclease n=1 Tax=Aneurinibacillus aneurinilyticus TaxID=1391 RepID=UPI0023F73B23|nr:HNH endonuclease [Aneurinibacillus aneurinilyticus]MCI1694295.1 HNH endonuclease [Aneurinibacillus aneurinilyticus]
MHAKNTKGGSFGRKLEDFHHTIKKRLSDFRISSENDRKTGTESDFIYYEVEIDKVLDIGSEVQFKEKMLVVCEVYTEMKDSLLRYQHHHQDGKTMILVDEKVHAEFTHSGGISNVNGKGSK